MIQYDDEDIEIVMKETGYDKAKAEKYFIEVAKDVGDDVECSLDILDIIHNEVKAKANGARKDYVVSDKVKERKPRERKVDTEKAEILEFAKKGLTLMMNSGNITVENETKLHFNYNGTDYTLNLVKHRPPKK